MLKNIRNDLLYLLGILNAITKIRKYSKNISNAEELFKINDQLNYNACLNLLSFIGENANKLSDELLLKYKKEADWSRIINFRNRIVHDYQGLDIFIVYRIINDYLSGLEINICKIIENELLLRNFDKEEYLLAKNNEYYKFIDFAKIKFPLS